MMGSPRMDYETLQALIEVYKVRASNDLLSIIMDEAEGLQGRTAVLELLRAIPAGPLSDDEFAPVRRQACQFCLNAADFDLADRLARNSEHPEDLAMRARALQGLGREQEAQTVYRQAVAQDPALRNRELERFLGIRPSSAVSQQAKIISLTSYSARRENRHLPDRPDLIPDTLLEDLDDAAVTFGDVAGLEDVKNEIRRRIVLPYLKPTLFERYRQKPGGSLLFYGPPGCGKTLIARATAGESDARFLSVSPEEILDKYAGDAEKRLRVFFDEARAEPPAILFFDDFELLGRTRSASHTEAAPALIAAFLSELDETLRDNSGVLVIAATNAPWAIDPALYRAGRFQRTIYIPPPPLEARKKVLEDAIASVPGHDKIALDRVARKTAGYSGADLRMLASSVNSIALGKSLAEGADVPVSADMFDQGLKSFAASTPAWVAQARVMLRPLERDEFLSRLFAPVFRS
jgi:transitional endoplasmic reticulum ATPase